MKRIISIITLFTLLILPLLMLTRLLSRIMGKQKPRYARAG